jgi:hypothetical protein
MREAEDPGRGPPPLAFRSLQTNGVSHGVNGNCDGNDNGNGNCGRANGDGRDEQYGRQHGGMIRRVADFARTPPPLAEARTSPKKPLGEV